MRPVRKGRLIIRWRWLLQRVVSLWRWLSPLTQCHISRCLHVVLATGLVNRISTGKLALSPYVLIWSHVKRPSRFQACAGLSWHQWWMFILLNCTANLLNYFMHVSPWQSAAIESTTTKLYSVHGRFGVRTKDTSFLQSGATDSQ